MSNPRRPPKILLTGFEPFGGEPVNPSLEVAQALDGVSVNGAQVVSLGLPVVYTDAADGLLRALHTLSPVMVVALGQSALATGLVLERVAVNLTDCAQPDNAGVVRCEQPVLPNGPAAYFSTLPLGRILSALREAGVPASMSSSAGHYVCNHVFYTLQHQLAARALPAGFVHLPLLPAQAEAHPGRLGLPLDAQVAAVRLLLETAYLG